MNRVVITLLAIASVCVAMPTKNTSVKSKAGPVQLLRAAEGEVLCTAGSGETMTLLQEVGDYALVRASCAKGWIAKEKLEQVQVPVNAKIMLGGIEIDAGPGGASLVDIFKPTFVAPDDVVNMDRDFMEYLAQTMDRESIEMENGEN